MCMCIHDSDLASHCARPQVQRGAGAKARARPCGRRPVRMRVRPDADGGMDQDKEEGGAGQSAPPSSIHPHPPHPSPSISASISASRHRSRARRSARKDSVVQSPVLHAAVPPVPALSQPTASSPSRGRVPMSAMRTQWAQRLRKTSVAAISLETWPRSPFSRGALFFRAKIAPVLIPLTVDRRVCSTCLDAPARIAPVVVIRVCARAPFGRFPRRFCPSGCCAGALFSFFLARWLARAREAMQCTYVHLSETVAEDYLADQVRTTTDRRTAASTAREHKEKN